MSLFNLGMLVASQGIAEAVQSNPEFKAYVDLSLARHQSGDWGLVCEEDKAANKAALHYGSRLLSAYEFDGKKFWIITEANRAVTTVLYPSEY